MARSIRIVYPGAFYHVMARGNRRETIFKDDDDRRFFLKALFEVCEMTGLWDRMTVGMPWISEQLAMKSAGNASTQIRRMKKMKHRKQDLPAALREWTNQSQNVTCLAFQLSIYVA